jgi:predicted lysophospholipase L1 biosynthesis ABC-type transport system permease subunit
VGRIVRFSGPKGPPFEIVGVARDFTKGTPRAGVHAEFATYFPYRDPEALNRGAQSRLRVMLIVLRTAGPPLALADRVRQELRAIDPALPVLRINTVDQQVDEVLARDRLLAALSSFLGGSALLLSSVGLFGLVSYHVARRTNEIGLRLAVGATRSGVPRMILADSSRLVASGLVCGLAAAVPLVRLIGSRLYGVTAADPLTLVVVTSVIALVAGGAVAVPARRAVRVDPASALRCE